MFHKVIKPSGLLQQFISYYYVVETNNSFEFAAKQRVYPTGSIVLVLHYGNPSLMQIHDEKPVIEPRTVLCGQQTKFYDLSLSGKTGMFIPAISPISFEFNAFLILIFS